MLAGTLVFSESSVEGGATPKLTQIVVGKIQFPHILLDQGFHFLPGCSLECSLRAGGGRQAAEAWGVRVTGSRLGWWAREGWGGRVFHGESRPETCHQGAPSTLHVASAQLAQPPATMGGEETSCPRRVYSCWKGFGFRYCCWDFVLFCFVSFFLVWLVFFLREGKKKFVIISSKAPIIYL